MRCHLHVGVFAAIGPKLMAFLFVMMVTSLCDKTLPAQSVSRIATTTTLAVTSGGSAVTSVASVSVVTLTATVIAGTSPVSPGKVNFCDATAKYCTDVHIVGSAQLTKAGTATVHLRPRIGSHSYKAVFSGTNLVLGSASGTASLTVTGLFPSSTTMTKSGSAQAYTLTATVKGSGSGLPTGQVSFVDTSDANAVVGKADVGTSPQQLSFLTASTPSMNSWAGPIVVADFNGDGIPDMAVGNDAPQYNGPGSVTILLGDGDGTFTAAPVLTTGDSFPDNLTVGDFNGDGVPDLVVTNSESGTLSIFLGNGDGTFTEMATSPNAPGAGAVAVGDFNGDGNQDLIVSTSNSTVTIFLGKGDGTFSQAGNPIPIGGSGFAVGDFNGDGVLDLAVLTVGEVCGDSGPCGNGTVTIMLGNGDGTFTMQPAKLTTGVGYGWITIGDFNGDGNADLAVNLSGPWCGEYDCGNGSVMVFLGNGDGTFTPVKQLAVTGIGPLGLVVGDFNGDGITDLAMANEGAIGATTLTDSVLLGNGDGTFTTVTVNLPSFNSNVIPGPVAAADFNADGVSDLATSIYMNCDVDVQLGETQAANSNPASVTLPADSGTHTVIAQYSGDAGYGPSASSSVSLASPLATPSVGLSLSPNPATYGDRVDFEATVSGQVGTPSGTVAFYDGSEKLNLAPLNGDGIARFEGKLAVGRHVISAAYEGNLRYAADTSSAEVVFVKRARQTIDFAHLSSLVNYGISPRELSAKASSGLPVKFSAVGPAILAGDKMTIVGAGTIVVTARQAGSEDYLPATAVQTVRVDKAKPKVTLQPSATSVKLGATITFTVKASGAGITPTGKVELMNAGKVLFTGALDLAGDAKFTTHRFDLGKHSILAHYEGNRDYTEAISSTVNIEVTPQ